LKKKTITLSEKDFNIPEIHKKKDILDELSERYRRRINYAVRETDKRVIRYLQKVKGSTIHQTATDLKINYKTMRDVYRRLEDAEIVKFTTKLLPARTGNKKYNLLFFSLTPKFIKVSI